MSLLLALALASPVQDIPGVRTVTPPVQLAMDAFRVLPKQVAGMDIQYADSHHSQDPFAMYKGETLDPMITVVFADIAKQGDWQAARLLARGMPDHAGVLKMLEERRFAVASKPGANAFFGEYVTNKGVMQVWLIEHEGLRTLVSAQILRVEDRQRVFDAVMAELLGGATLLPEQQARKN